MVLYQADVVGGNWEPTEEPGRRMSLSCPPGWALRNVLPLLLSATEQGLLLVRSFLAGLSRRRSGWEGPRCLQGHPQRSHGRDADRPCDGGKEVKDEGN